MAASDGKTIKRTFLQLLLDSDWGGSRAGKWVHSKEQQLVKHINKQQLSAAHDMFYGFSSAIVVVVVVVSSFFVVSLLCASVNSKKKFEDFFFTDSSNKRP